MKKIILSCGLALLILLGAAIVSDLLCNLSNRHSSMQNILTASARDNVTYKGLCGLYQLEDESGGQKPGKNARIILNFRASGVVTLKATRPGETLTDIGTFRERNGKITLELPALGKRVEMQPYSLNATKLVLPFQIISEAAGRSNWRRIDTKPDILRDSIGSFYANIPKMGRTAALQQMVATLKNSSEVRDAQLSNDVVLVTYKSGYQEFFLAPESSGKSNRKSVTVSSSLSKEESQMNRSILNYGLFAMVGTAHAQFLPMGGLGRPVTPAVRGGSFAETAWLANEPKPVSHGDAPSVRKALILSAFHTLPVLSPNDISFTYETMKDNGENLDGIVKELRHAKFEVMGPIIDQKVNVKFLIEQLSGKNWGVFFFSTHCGIWNNDQFLVTGEEIPVPFCMSRENREEYIQNYWENFKLNGGNLTNDQYRQVANQLIFGYIYEDDIPFVCVKSGFFSAINSNFSHSLVYLSACHTTEMPNLRDAMQPSAFLGWNGVVSMQLNADMSLAFFRCLSRRTRSDREAWDFGVKYCEWKKVHDPKYSLSKTSPKVNPRNFLLYRWGKFEPEKELSFHACNILKVVRNQVCMFKGGKGLDDTVRSLYKCDKTELNGIKTSPFCLAAFNGVDVPDKELDIVKGESCGYEGGESRFTLEEE